MTFQSLQEEFEQKRKEYSYAFDEITRILDKAVEKYENGEFSDDDKKKLNRQISDLGPEAPRVVGNILPRQKYTIFFRYCFDVFRPHLEICLRDSLWGTRRDIVEFLPVVGEQGIDLLKYAFENDEELDTRRQSAMALAKIGVQGLNCLHTYLSGDSQQNQENAIGGIAYLVYLETEYGKVEEKYKPLLEILVENLVHANDNVRIECIYALSKFKLVSLNILADSAAHENPNLRMAALQAIIKNKINVSTAAIFVRFLEDPIKQISDLTLSSINNAIVVDPLSAANAIVDELILRASNLPKELFNSEIVAAALQKTFKLSTPVYGIILHRLCSLSYEHYQDAAMARCVFSARLLNKKEFASLVSEKASENPLVAQKILQVLDTGLNVLMRETYRKSDHYVNPERIVELKEIDSSSFDLVKLISLCDELNTCYQNEAYLAVTMLLRALLDHVPPIFGYQTFNEVANNYGGRSIRKSFLNLQNSSRNIADTYLHQPIRAKETLPNHTQVNFSNDLDVVLGEVVRILK